MTTDKLWKIVANQFDATCPPEIIKQEVESLQPVTPLTRSQLLQAEEQFICSYSHEND
jgi:hypothetical protein